MRKITNEEIKKLRKYWVEDLLKKTEQKAEKRELLKGVVSINEIKEIIKNL